MATKEVMGTAPLIVFLYDRTFVEGGFRKHGFDARLLYWVGWHLGLPRVLDCRVGFPWWHSGYKHQRTVWNYALAQFNAIVISADLSVWPQSLDDCIELG